MKVLCTWHATDDEIQFIKGELPPNTNVVAPRGKYVSRFECTFKDIEHDLVDADAMIGFVVPEGSFEIAEKLKILSWLHAGCNDLPLQMLKKRGVIVANDRGANAIAVAEQAIMFMLALAKQTIVKHRVFEKGRRIFPTWTDEHRGAMIEGRTVGVIGLGEIGSRIATKAKGLGMHVLGIRRNIGKPVSDVDEMFSMQDLHAFLPRCDYVVLAAPITKETRQCIGEAELAILKPTAFLINIARGALTDEIPLYNALTSGRLRGYAADVWWRYSHLVSFPGGYVTRCDFGQLPNVIGSVDEASNADDVLERHLEQGTQTLVEFAAGTAITRSINLDLGY